MVDTRYEVTICNSCGGSGAFRIIGQTDLVAADNSDHFFPNEGYTIRATRCLHCGAMNLSLTDNDFFFDGGETFIKDPSLQIIYPEKRIKDLLGLPPAIREELMGALATNDFRYYAVALGRVLDLVCEDKGLTGNGTLAKKIEALVKMRELPPKLATLATQLKDFRNISAHGNLGQITRNQIPLLDYLCEAILDYIYHVPEMTKLVQRDLDNLKKHQSEI